MIEQPESFNLIEFSTNIFLASASLSKARDMLLKEETKKNVTKTDITIFITLSYHQSRGMLTVNASPFPAIYDILEKWWYHGGTMNFLKFSRTRKSVEKQRVPVAQ